MNDVIFEQDKELQRPYTVKDLLNLAKDPRLAYPHPKVNPGNWLLNLLRTQRMSREQIIEKVAEDLWLTLEKRDGLFVFRFPNVWKPKDVQEMQRAVLDGIAMLESQRSLVVWLRDLLDNFSAGIVRLWSPWIAPIAVAASGVIILLGAIYTFSVGTIGWGVALWVVALLCCSVRISVSCTEVEEKDLVPPCGLGGYVEPDLENAFPLGGSHVKKVTSTDREKINAQLPAPQRSLTSAMETINLLSSIRAVAEDRIARQSKTEKSDDCYDEPQAIYPIGDEAMTAQKTIVWHCLPNESEEDRIDRLNKELHRIFFDGKEVCTDKFLLEDGDWGIVCSLCGEYSHNHLYHSTPRFLESLDAMQLIVESGRFAEVREEFFHWLPQTGKPPYECRVLTYNRKRLGDRMYFTGKGHSRQEAFCLAALASQDYTVLKDENNGHHEIH